MYGIGEYISDKKRILIVDDDASVVKTLRIILEFAGYVVIATCFSKEGLKIAKEEKPDLILLDILMPWLDGNNFLKAIRLDEGTKDIAVIIITAKDKMKELFGPEGIVEYIVKPFEYKELLEKVKRQFVRNKRNGITQSLI